MSNQSVRAQGTAGVVSNTGANFPFRFHGPDSPLCVVDIDSWSGPFSAEVRETACAALERGKVLVFPNLPFLFEEDEQCLLSPALSNGKSKNISRKPTGQLSGIKADSRQTQLVGKMMGRFATNGARLVAELMPRYADNLERARTSFRPVEIEGRTSSPLQDDTRLHIDAFPSQPMHGRRILRLFSNVNPGGAPRVWRVGEPFEDMARKLESCVNEGSRAYSALLATIGITKKRRSAYDNLMLGYHNAAKLDAAYQADVPQSEIRFPSGVTWLCYTDQVMHAVCSGQFALEQTFHLDVEAMAEPALSPLKVLERLRGHSLSTP